MEGHKTGNNGNMRLKLKSQNLVQKREAMKEHFYIANCVSNNFISDILTKSVMSINDRKNNYVSLFKQLFISRILHYMFWLVAISGVKHTTH
jgi:hypothetical protein